MCEVVVDVVFIVVCVMCVVKLVVYEVLIWSVVGCGCFGDVLVNSQVIQFSKNVFIMQLIEDNLVFELFGVVVMDNSGGICVELFFCMIFFGG